MGTFCSESELLKGRDSENEALGRENYSQVRDKCDTRTNSVRSNRMVLILEIAAGVFIGKLLYEWLVGSKLRAAQKDEDDAVAVWNRTLSSDPPPSKPDARS
jgi:hypothetical protein